MNRTKFLFFNNSFAREAVTYLISNVLYSSIPFILLPILTRFLTKEEYGEVSMYYTLVSLLGAFIGVNSHSFASRKYFDRVDEEDLREWNTSSMFVLVYSSIFMFIILFLCNSYISNIFGLNSAYIYMAYISSVFLFLTNYRLIQWQIRKKAKYYGIFQVSQALINFIITILFVVVMGMKGEGRINAYFITSIIFGILGLIVMNRDRLFDFNRPKISQIKEILVFGLPLIFHVGGNFLLGAADRVIIKNNMSLGDVGIYTVGVQFSLVLGVVFNAINKAYVPWLFEKLGDASLNTKVKITKITSLYFLILIAVIGLGFVIGPFIIESIVGNEFTEAREVIGYLLAGQCFVGAYLMVTNYIFYVKRTGVLATITVFSGIFNLVLMYYLTKIYGLKGAAVSFTFSMFIRFIITFLVAQKYYPMPWIRGVNVLKTK